jgi:RNA recognition motif-containing protein
MSVLFYARLADCLIIDKPQDDPSIRGDAFKTLIVARLSYEATEEDLEKEFARFGPIERVSRIPYILVTLLTLQIDSNRCRYTSR